MEGSGMERFARAAVEILFLVVVAAFVAADAVLHAVTGRGLADRAEAAPSK